MTNLNEKMKHTSETSVEMEPWASVKGGKWHRTTTLAVNFRDPVKSLCGLTFEPFNVSKGFPSYSRPDLWACAKCEAAYTKAKGES